MEKLFSPIQKLKHGQSREYQGMYKYKIKLVIILECNHNLEQTVHQLVVAVVAEVALPDNHRQGHSKVAHRTLHLTYKIVCGPIYKIRLSRYYLHLESSIYHRQPHL